MISIAMFNNKGGVGKTSLVCNLAHYIAKEYKKRIMIVDADPQCNTTVNIIPDEEFNKIYYDRKEYTIYDWINPLVDGEGYAQKLETYNANKFGIELLVGDPRLAFLEDFLATDWNSIFSGQPRSMMSTLVFAELLSRCQEYDIVFFDMGPSLGAINRSILLACDYFITPITPDIFNMLAMENIGKMLCEWKEKFEDGLNAVGKRTDKYREVKFKLQYLGYVAQMFSTRGGKAKMADAYEKVMKQVPQAISKNLNQVMQKGKNIDEYNLGSIKNFNSIIPISQMAHKPIIDLGYQDGVVGAHFNRLEEYKDILKIIAENIYINVGGF